MAATQSAIAVIGVDIGKNSFHIIGLDGRGVIVLRQKWSRGQVEARLANMSPCLIGMEACVGAHHLSRRLKALGHDARLMPARYVRPYPHKPLVSYRITTTIRVDSSSTDDSRHCQMLTYAPQQMPRLNHGLGADGFSGSLSRSRALS
jgi:hypothetical protein